MRRATTAVCTRCRRGSADLSRQLHSATSSFVTTKSTSHTHLARSSFSRSPLLPLATPLAPSPSRAFSSISAALDEWNRFNKAGLQYLDEGRFPEAEALFISALRSSQVILRDGSSTSSVPLYLAMSNLSVAQRHQGKLKESQGNAVAALDAVKALKDAVGLDVLAHMHRELGLVYELQGQWAQAKDAYHQAQSLYRQRLQQVQEKGSAQPTSTAVTTSPASPSSTPVSPSSSLPHLHQQRAGALFGLALTLEKLQLPSDALPFYREALTEAELGYGPKTVNMAEGHVALGRLLLAEAEAKGKAEAEKEAAKQRAGEELMAALEIYGEKKDPKLLEVLPLYMRALGVHEDNVEEFMKAPDT